jgi:hypothetical protein
MNKWLVYKAYENKKLFAAYCHKYYGYPSGLHIDAKIKLVENRLYLNNWNSIEYDNEDELLEYNSLHENTIPNTIHENNNNGENTIPNTIHENNDNDNDENINVKECNICYIVKNKRKFKKLTCGHSFCKTCINKLKKNIQLRRCPICREFIEFIIIR